MISGTLTYKQVIVPTCQLEASEDHTKVNFGPDLNQAQRKELLETGRSATRILTDLPLRTQLEQFSFDLLEKEPVRTKQYPLPHTQVQVVKKEVEDMLKLGVAPLVLRQRETHPSGDRLRYRRKGMPRIGLGHPEVRSVLVRSILCAGNGPPTPPVLAKCQADQRRADEMGHAASTLSVQRPSHSW